MNYILPKCTKCESKSVYVRIDGTLVCRRCGHQEKTNSNGDRDVTKQQ